jgi:rare lipoprotein A
MRVELLPEETRVEIAKIKGGYRSDNLKLNSLAPAPSAAPVRTVSIKSLALVPGTTRQKPKKPVGVTKVQTKPLSGVELTKLSKTTSVQQFPVKESFVFVQAAAFSNAESAGNLKDKINKIGETRVYKVLVKGKTFYRVRIGPFTNTTSADKALAELIKKGFPGARIVVSNTK